MTTKRSVFFPNLDGLRFFSFLSVFLYHSWHTSHAELRDHPVRVFLKRELFGNGELGVNFFFVLSGFLITYLLLEEERARGYFSIGNFYLRRILRIWPLFYACVGFGFVVFPLFKRLFGQEPAETARPIYYLFFLNNFDLIASGLPDASILGVLWSVAVEEQFYLAWPILLRLVPARRRTLLFAGLVVLSLGFRAVWLDHPAMLAHHTLSCIGDMAVGGWGAQQAATSAEFRERLRRMSRPLIAAIYALAGLLYFGRDELVELGLPVLLERLMIAVACLLVILEQNYAERSLLKLSRLRRISRLGNYTYGLYCLHFVGILIAITVTTRLGINRQLWQLLLIDGALSLALTTGLAWSSYHMFEKHFLRLKDRFAYVVRGEGG